MKQRCCMQAIVTKYHGPGNVRGSRVSATAQAGRVTLEWDARLNREANHHAAAAALCAKMGWTWPLVGGGLPGNHTNMVWVQAEPESVP